MVVIESKCFLHSRRICGSFDPLRMLFDFFPRVQVIVSLPGLLRVPPRFGIAAMGAKVKYVTDRFGLLPDRSGEIRQSRFDSEAPMAHPIFFEKSCSGG